MKKKIFQMMMALTAICLAFTSCSSDDDPVNPTPEVAKVNYGLTLEMPLNIEKATLKEAKAVFTNVQTKQQETVNTFTLSDKNYVAEAVLPVGTYNVEVTGNIDYVINGQTINANVKATQNNVKVEETNTATMKPSTTMALNIYNAGSGFVISEIFFAGTKTPEGKDYVNDQYIKIANNTDTVMYADGLALVRSAFQTNMKNAYTPDVMNSAMTVEDVFIIPGTGKEHPVKPGEEIVIAWNARNHKEFNANSIDLSKADFQFYNSMTLESEDENGEEVDTEVQNANVPLLIHWYGDPEGRLTPNRGGVRAWDIARLDNTDEAIKKNYEYEVKWVEADDPTNFENVEKYLMIPNTWILDAVNLAVIADNQWRVVAPSVDAGFTSWAETINDEGSYRKAVIRKKNGAKWVDSNNSTNDFEAEAVPSYFKF